MERSLRVNLEKELGKLCDPKTPDLITGSSINHDLDSDLYDNTKFIARSGAPPDDITEIINEKVKDGKQYGRVVLVAGGNQLDYEGDNDNITETMLSMEKCVAKTITPAVAFCELPHRTHTDCASDNIRHFNNELHGLAEKCECTFIKTSHKFLLSDNTVNDGYLENNLIHLNLRGSAKLVECLDIKMKDPASKQVKKEAAYKDKIYCQHTPTPVPRNPARSPKIILD